MSEEDSPVITVVLPDYLLSTGSPRPLIPVSLRRQVFDALHNLSHPGVRPTRRLVSRAFVWLSLQICLRLGQRLSALSAE